MQHTINKPAIQQSSHSVHWLPVVPHKCNPWSHYIVTFLGWGKHENTLYYSCSCTSSWHCHTWSLEMLLGHHVFKKWQKYFLVSYTVLESWLQKKRLKCRILKCRILKCRTVDTVSVYGKILCVFLVKKNFKIWLRHTVCMACIGPLINICMFMLVSYTLSW